MCFAPKIIIFTSNEKKFLEYNKEYKNIDNKFYNIGGIATIIEEIEDFLFNNKTQKNDSIFLTQSLDQLPSKTENTPSKDTIEEKAINKSDEVELIFEYIDKKEKLILPLLFKPLIDNVSNDNIEKYTNFLYETYSEEYDEIKDLLEQIKPIKNIPIEILSKYYARLFTHYCNFHKDVNKDLRLNIKERHLPFIKTLYKGVKLKSLPLAKDTKLYRGSIISGKEIKNIKNHLAKKIKGLPGSMVFSKSFLSFSKDENEAKKFWNNTDCYKNFFKVMFILEKDDNLGYNLTTHGDIEKISFYPKEKEVLFFPFSSFEIKDLNMINIGKEKRYEIKLFYLGKYLKEIEKDKNIIINGKAIPDSKFKTHLTGLGLIEKEKIEKLNTKTLFDSYTIFKEEIKSIKNVEIKITHKDIKQEDPVKEKVVPDNNVNMMNKKIDMIPNNSLNNINMNMMNPMNMNMMNPMNMSMNLMNMNMINPMNMMNPMNSQVIDLYPEVKNSDKINIVMREITGLKMTMSVPIETSIRGIIRKYLEKIEVEERFLYGKRGLIFIINNKKLDIDSYHPICSIFRNFIEILVIDGRARLQGA